ncbi:MAG: ATP-binding cassette domain-containing protein, partial [Rhizobiaceae bacterium]
MNAILRLDGVHTDIAQYHILHGVSFDVPEGGVHVLLGRNGAGKTTTLRTVMGLWRAVRGKVLFRGGDITGLHTSDIARLGVAYVPENMGIFGGLTVEENMRLATTAGRFDEARLGRVFALFPALETFWMKQAFALSGGQKQMLA